LRASPTRSSARFQDDTETVDIAAATLGAREDVEVVEHGKNGRIQDSDSYGNDPNPPRDRKD
jgi:hypothetical protein